jgi:hypothetical protein
MPLVIPWEFCAQANHRLRPIVVKGRPRLSTNPEYARTRGARRPMLVP